MNEFLVPTFASVRSPDSSLSNGQLSDSVPGAGFRARIQKVHHSLSVNGDETTRGEKSKVLMKLFRQAVVMFTPRLQTGSQLW